MCIFQVPRSGSTAKYENEDSSLRFEKEVV